MRSFRVPRRPAHGADPGGRPRNQRGREHALQRHHREQWQQPVRIVRRRGGALPHGLDLETVTTAIPAGSTSATVDVITGADLILLQTVTTSITAANGYGVVVTPDGLATPTARLPGTGYTRAFIIPQSYTGTGITATARADGFVVTLAAGDSTTLLATYRVAVRLNAINTRERLVRLAPLAPAGRLFRRRLDPLAESRYPTFGDGSQSRVFSSTTQNVSMRVERGFDWRTARPA